jgi:hypothetical protein
VKPDIIVKNVYFSKEPLKAGEEVKIILKMENTGLATGTNIPLVIYDQVDFSSKHEISRKTIPAIKPNQVYYHNITWEPNEGNFNITIRIDPESTLDELRVDNNLWLEPVMVGKGGAKDSDDSSFIIYVGAIVAVILILCIVYFIYSRGPGAKDNLEADDEPPKTAKRPPTSHKPRGPPPRGRAQAWLNKIQFESKTRK